MKENPWAEWLTRFRTPAGPAPRKLAPYQFYMAHKDHKEKVTTVFEVDKVGVPVSQHLNLRGKIARTLLEAEPEELQKEMKEGAEAEHAEMMEKHEDALEGLPALDEESLDE